jgi:hypothetical protein
MDINTIQKREKLNQIRTYGDIGNGGAYHKYEIYSEVVTEDDSKKQLSEFICFQNGPRLSVDSRQGILDSDLLEIVRHRLKCFQEGNFSCIENENALRHIEEALLWMNKRVEDRIERNVLGTNNK